MVSFRLPDDVDIGVLRKALWDRRIEMPLILRPDRTLIRVSCHFYTTEAEIDRLADVLPGLIGS
jgi:isopenicillin-N epimerase